MTRTCPLRNIRDNEYRFSSHSLSLSLIFDRSRGPPIMIFRKSVDRETLRQIFEKRSSFLALAITCLLRIYGNFSCLLSIFISCYTYIEQYIYPNNYYREDI